jgi:hypothetical protein
MPQRKPSTQAALRGTDMRADFRPAINSREVGHPRRQTTPHYARLLITPESNDINPVASQGGCNAPAVASIKMSGILGETKQALRDRA